MTEPTYYNKNGLSSLKAYNVRCDKKGQRLSDLDKAIDYLKLLRKEME